jgi:phosphoglucosamine mutase
MPTPAVAYLTRALRLSAGIVISAWHNPYDDKHQVFFRRWFRVADEVETAIETSSRGRCNEEISELGKVRRIDDRRGATSSSAKAFPARLDLRGRVGHRYTHGATYHVAAHVSGWA